MSKLSQSRLARYAVAAASIVVATAVRRLLDPVLGDGFPFITLFLAVLAAAWYGGFGPAVVATGLGAATSAVFLLPPHNRIWVEGFTSQAGLVFFVGCSLGIALLARSMREAQRRVEAIVREREAAVARHLEMERQLTTLVQASGALTATLEPPAVLASILDLARQLLPADAHAIWRFDAASGLWHIGASAGLTPEYQQAAIKGLDSATRIPDGPLVADDVAALPMLADRQAAFRAEGIRSLLAVPLRLHGQGYGTLVAYHRQPHRFGDVEVPVATALANLAAAAIGSAELYQEQTRLRTEAQYREDELGRRQRQLQLVTDTAPVLLGHCDAERRFKFVNVAYAARFGLHPRDVIGRTIPELFGPEAYEAIRPHLDAALAGQPVDFEVALPYAGAGPQYMHCAYRPEFDGGRVVGCVAAITIVTESRRVARALRESEERFSRFMQHLPGLAWLKDAQGRYVYANEAALVVFGREPDDLYGKTDGELFPPETAAQFASNDRRALASEAGVQVIETLDHADGVRHFSIVSKFPIPGPDGNPALIGGMAIDVTERKQAEEALRQSEERLRLALEAGRMGVWDWNVATNEIKWSDGVEPIHGLSPGAFAGTMEAFRALIHPADRERVERAIAKSLADRTRYDVEFRNVWPDGSVHWLAGKGKVYGDDDEPARMVGVALDVTARRRAEQAARLLADASAALATLVDDDSTLQTVARLAVPAFADWCAIDMLDDGGQLQRRAVAHVDPAKVELAHELRRRHPPDPAAAGGAWHVVRTGRSEFVREITDEMLTSAITDPDHLRTMRDLGLRSYMGVPLAARGRVHGVITFIAAESGRRYDAADLAVAEDLAYRVAIAIENGRLYQALKEADRRKDEFLALLGHELRNPLAPIQNALHVLTLPQADRATADQAREMMERQVEHMVRLVDDLLDVSRIMRGKVELRREPINLSAVITRAVETAQPAIDAGGHTLNVSVPDELLAVNGDVVRLAQVVGNLLHNAAKYTERGGQIALTAERDGAHAVVRVRDSGVGIPAEILTQIFEMFFQADRRTKDGQGGLGIGLSLVHGLVELHGGTVEAHSDGPGRGSEFIVRLPLLPSADPGEQARPASRSAAAVLPKHRVLVVDDSTDAADSLAMLLRLSGQEVAVAYDGATALSRAEAEPPEIAFLDLGMPKMDGCELARRFRANSALASVTLVALTGWGQPEDRQRTKEAGFDHHIVKPVALDTLRRLLGEPA